MIIYSLRSMILQTKLTLFQIRDLRHDNICAFIGACTDPPHICILTEYCTRGSLKVGYFSKFFSP